MWWLPGLGAVLYLPVGLLVWAVTRLGACVLLFGVFALVLARSGAGQFVLGGRLGLLLAWRTNAFEVVRLRPFQAFECQAHDWHNRFCARGLHEAELRHIETGRVLNVVHTHLDADGVGRCAQARELPSPSGDLALCMGDLNASPETPEVRLLKQAWMDTGGDAPTWMSLNDFIYRTLYGILTQAKTDYILCSQPQTARNHTVHSLPNASVHALIQTTLVLDSPK